MMKQPVLRISCLTLLIAAFFQAPLYAVADLDLGDSEPMKFAPPIERKQPAQSVQSVQSAPISSPISSPDDPSDTSPKDAASSSKEYFYSFTLPLPAGNVLPVIPDGEKLTPPEQIPINLPSVAPMVKKSLAWRNHALLLFTSTPDKSVIFKSYPRGTSDLVTALVNQSNDSNYKITTDYIAAGHMLIEVPEQVSETRKPLSFVIAFRMKDDNNCELGLKVLPPVSKYSVNLAQNYLAKVEQRLLQSIQNTY